MVTMSQLSLYRDRADTNGDATPVKDDLKATNIQLEDGRFLSVEVTEDERAEHARVMREAAEEGQRDYLAHQAAADVYRGGDTGVEDEEDEGEDSDREDRNTFDPASVGQPTMFSGTLKSYQLDGMRWLANLYHNRINGILADEMGLGKTVQTVAFLSHLAEHRGVWGPFLIVSPSSTLTNWVDEINRFSPRLKVVPYWGKPSDRNVLRRPIFGGERIRRIDEVNNRKVMINTALGEAASPCHVVVTSYELAVADQRFFRQQQWALMILDEAHAIKSSSSARWTSLLQFPTLSRLLLTGDASPE